VSFAAITLCVASQRVFVVVVVVVVIDSVRKHLDTPSYVTARTSRVQFLAGAMMGYFLFATASRSALGHTQLPSQWVQEALSPVVKVITHLHLVPNLRMHGAIPPTTQYFS
jgi:hypothetical protein